MIETTPERVERLAVIVLKRMGYRPHVSEVMDVGRPGSIVLRVLADCPCGNFVRFSHAWPPGCEMDYLCREIRHEATEHLVGDGLANPT